MTASLFALLVVMVQGTAPPEPHNVLHDVGQGSLLVGLSHPHRLDFLLSKLIDGGDEVYLRPVGKTKPIIVQPSPSA